MSELKKIEKEILRLSMEISGKEKELSHRLSYYGVTQGQLDRLVKADNKPLESKFERLEIKRRFILDRRESFIPKTMWNIVVPIVLSVVTAYIASKFFSK